jgi:hypothetical protein
LSHLRRRWRQMIAEAVTTSLVFFPFAELSCGIGSISEPATEVAGWHAWFCVFDSGANTFTMAPTDLHTLPGSPQSLWQTLLNV